MTIGHHPNEALLLDYASGALSEAWSLAVATHMALCPLCRLAVTGIEAVGGAILEEVEGRPVDAGAFETLMTRLDSAPAEPIAVGLKRPAAVGCVFPEPLRGYVGGDPDGLKWRRLGLDAAQIVLPPDERGAVARLLRIPAGKRVPEHGHRGLELTLVLKGAFSDSTGTYVRGDMQEADDSLKHRPHATQGEDCICLAVTEAPLRFSTIGARLAQPFFEIRSAPGPLGPRVKRNIAADR